MLPVGKGKNYSHFHEFRQIICPLNKHRQNKQKFCLFVFLFFFVFFFQIQVLKLISITTVFPVTVMLKGHIQRMF